MSLNLRNAAEDRKLQNAINDLRAEMLAKARAQETPLASPARTEDPNRPETEAQREPAKMKGKFPTAQEYAEHLAGRSLSPEEIQPVNTYTARGPTGQSMK